MPRVICDLPNASAEISGVKFHPLDDGRLISDEIAADQAERFISIPGYALDDGGATPTVAPAIAAPRLTKAQQKAKEKADAESSPPEAIDAGADEVF